MSILILGGQSRLGFELIRAFSDDYDVFSWSQKEVTEMDKDLLREKILKIKPILIVNAISFDDIDKCENSHNFPLVSYLNVEITAFLADIALNLGAIFMHFSTDQVFNGTSDKPFFLEDETPNPINRYGESKAKAEEEILKRRRFGLNFYLIRTSKLFIGNLNESEDGLENKTDFFVSLFKKYQEKNGNLSAVNEELSCFTYMPDLAQASKRLWELKVPFGIFHLVNERAVTWHEAALEYFRLKKMPVNLRPIRSEDLFQVARRPKFSVLKNEKVKKLRPWNHALAESLNVRF